MTTDKFILETGDDEISVDQVMVRIREEVAQLNSGNVARPISTSPVPLPSASSLASENNLEVHHAGPKRETTMVNRLPGFPENKSDPSERDMKQSLSKLPVFGSLLNWAYKVVMLPARFYALKQDFSNRAAWIDRYGELLKQGYYQATIQHGQIERKLVILDQTLKHVSAPTEGLLAIRDQQHQLEEQLIDLGRQFRDARTSTGGETEWKNQIEQQLDQLSSDLRESTKKVQQNTESQVIIGADEINVDDIMARIKAEKDRHLQVTPETDYQPPPAPSISPNRSLNEEADSTWQARQDKWEKEESLSTEAHVLNGEAKSLKAGTTQNGQQMLEKLRQSITDHSVILSTLEQMVYDLAAQQPQSLITRLQNETERNTLISVQLNQHLGHLAEVLNQIQENAIAAAQYSLKLEEKIGQELSEQRAIDHTAVRDELDQARVELGAALAQNLTTCELRLQEEVERCRQNYQHLHDQTASLAIQVNETSLSASTTAATCSSLAQQLSHELDEIRMRLLRAERKAAKLETLSTSAAISSADRESSDLSEINSKGALQFPIALVNGEANGSLPATFDYFLFEHRFRGSRTAIKERQRIYLEYFIGLKQVIDLGCGRGEFLELLKENGIPAIGVDSNPDMVEFCRDKNLEVEADDIFEYLSRLPDSSLDGIFSAQVIEHLSPQRIMKLLRLCAEKLNPGGAMIAETVNTNCSTALGNFYLDPTHIRPVPFEMLGFMLKQEGFIIKTTKFSSPVSGLAISPVLEKPPGVASEISLYQDYAIVANRI